MRMSPFLSTKHEWMIRYLVERHVDNLGVLKWYFFQNSSPTASGIIIVSKVTGCWDSVQYPISPRA